MFWLADVKLSFGRQQIAVYPDFGIKYFTLSIVDHVTMRLYEHYYNNVVVELFFVNAS